ncbi:MAG: response regulator transcription factor [Chloroflexi bacterium]|nr:response regulator transcription factor [Chloroflexota bacterium]MYE39933.1 response regulator transcription factor [Chloroflexota bacterium]
MDQAKLPKVMLVDDHKIMRDGLGELLEQSGGFEVVGQAGDGVAAVKLAQQLNPDVIIMDIMMPHKDGIEACREISETLPDTKVLILTASTEEDAVVEAVAAGATGYLQKYSGKEELLRTVHDVARGECHIPGDAIRRVFAGIRHAEERRKTHGPGGLTAREREILALFSQGLSYAEVAKVRENQPLTIRNAIYAIQDKLGIGTKQELVVWAVRNGLLDDHQVGR